MSQLLTQKEVCKKLNISRNALFEWRKKGRISASKIGRTIRFEESEIERVIKEGKENTSDKN